VIHEHMIRRLANRFMYPTPLERHVRRLHEEAHALLGDEPSKTPPRAYARAQYLMDLAGRLG